MTKTIFQYYFQFYPFIGGVEVYIANIIQNIPDYRFEVITDALPKVSIIENYSQNSTIRRFLPYDMGLLPLKTKIIKILFPYRIIADVIRQRKKYRYLSNAKFDLLHVHGGSEGNFLRVDSWLKCPLFIRLIDFTFISSPKLLTMHNLISPFTNNPMPKKFEHRIIDQFDNIIAVDKNIQSYVEEYAEDTNQDKNIWFIPNSVDTKQFTFTAPIEDKKLKIGFIGRLERSRGLKSLYNLIRNLPDYVEMHVIGAGSATYIDRFKLNIDISKIHFYKNAKNEDIPKFLSKVDVLFNPVLAEGISRVTLEAMSSGRPVIMLDKGDRYPIMHNHTGYLISENTIELLELLQYLHDNKNELQKIGKNARKIVEKKFSNNVVIPQIKKIYASLI